MSGVLIRSICPEDEQALIRMASGGSLIDIFGDCSGCHEWMGNFIAEAVQLEKENNPYREYLAFAVAKKENNEIIGSVGTSYYEDLQEIGVTYFVGSEYRGEGCTAEALPFFRKGI